MAVDLNFNVDPFAVANSWFGPGGGGMAGDDVRWMNDFTWKQSLRNEEFQHQLATHGIRMRAADAEAAGFHPLIGAGVNPASGQFGGALFNQPSPKMSGSGINMGANISRAQAATMTETDKALSQAQLEGIRANTAESLARKTLAELEIARLNQTPSIPEATQQYRDEDGNIITLNHPDVDAALRSDPIRMWGRSIMRGTYGQSLFKRLQDKLLNEAIKRR